MRSLRIIYIAAQGHSGTTLMARLLNLHPDVCSFGDFDGIQRIRDDVKKGKAVMCGCGKHGTECEFWTEVLGNVHQRIRNVDDLRDTKGREWKTKIVAAAEILKQISCVSGAAYVCEQTHNRRRVWQYSKLNIADIFILHLVRDPRGVVASTIRQKNNRHKSIVSASLSYALQNLRHAAGALRLRLSNRGNVKYMRVMYEDICRSPSDNMNEIFRRIGMEGISGNEQWLPTRGDSHIVGANSMKLRAIEHIKISDGFIVDTSRAWWLVSTLVNLPMILLFGYPITRTQAIKRYAQD